MASRCSTTFLILLVAVLALAAWAPAPCRAGMEGVYLVGDKQGWAPNVNYSGWGNTSHFYVGDWLGFKYERNVFDVAQVNQTAYDQCISTEPINYWNKTDTYVRLNHTGRIYFICTKGTCYGGMKVSVLVEKRPPPAAAPATANHKNDSPSLLSWRGLLMPVLIALAAVSSIVFTF